MPIGEALVRNGVITKEQLDAALEEQKKHPEESLGDVLKRLGFLGVDDLECCP